MKKIHFIHCADIHIGANPLGIEERFEDMGKAFSQVVQYAIEEEVDFVVVAGDFFHKKQLDARTLEQAVNLLEPLKQKDIPVYITEGNHDMTTYTTSYSWLEFLCAKGYIYLLKPHFDVEEEQIKLFPWDEENRQGSIIHRSDCYIVGLGYPGATAATMIQHLSNHYPKAKDKPVITLLHTGIDRFVTEGMGGLREEELDPIVAESHYIALGHIHKRYGSEEKRYYNPGSLENVKISENPFEKGFYHVELDPSSQVVRTEFRPIRIRNNMNLTIDLSHLENIEEVYEEVPKKVAAQFVERAINQEEGIMLQLKLIGAIKSGGNLVDLRKLKAALQQEGKFLHIEVLNFLGVKSDLNLPIRTNQSREEIDRQVIRSLIQNQGFEENQVDAMLEVVLQLKELASRSPLTLDGREGEDMKNMILQMVGDEDENTAVGN